MLQVQFELQFYNTWDTAKTSKVEVLNPFNHLVSPNTPVTLTC